MHHIHHNKDAEALGPDIGVVARGAERGQARAYGKGSSTVGWVEARR